MEGVIVILVCFIASGALMVAVRKGMKWWP